MSSENKEVRDRFEMWKKIIRVYLYNLVFVIKEYRIIL